MKKSLLKTMTMVIVAIILMAQFSVGITATGSDFFAGSAGTGIVVGDVNGGPFYTAYGENATYSSIDGENWLKRYTESDTPVKGLDSLAYGNDIGIGIVAGEITADYFTRDMEYDKDVYNYVQGINGADGYFIYLIPEIYYDSYSSLFFCHGFNAEAKDFDLYYSDGVLTAATYGGNSVNAITWTKTTGDFLDLHPWDWNGPADDQNFTLAWLVARPRPLTGNGKGYVIVPYGHDMNMRCAPVANNCSCGAADIRRTCTVLKTTQNGEVIAGHAYTTATMLAKGAAITDNGVALFQASAKNTKRLYVANLNSVEFETGKVVSFAGVDVLPGYADNETTAAAMVSGNDVYFSKPATNHLYKVSVAIENNNVSLSDAENILEGSSYGVSDTSAWTVKDMKVINSEKAIMLINASNKAYMYEVNLETYALKALAAEETYVSIDGSDANITIAPNTYKPHGLELLIGDEAPTTDKMVYEYVDDDGAKYFLDLDGIDVNGIFAWDDAQSGTCTFTLTARSADYPSVMKTVEITATIGE